MGISLSGWWRGYENSGQGSVVSGQMAVVSDNAAAISYQHPAYEQVFPVVFTADGKSIGYGVKDGQKLIWMVEKLDE